MPGLAVETVSSLEGFDALEAEWDALVAAMPRPCPFLLHGYVRAWWATCGRAGEPAVHVARRDGRLIGAFPLHVRRLGGLSVAGFVGGAQMHLADLLLAPGEGGEVADALVELAVRRADFDFADLYGMPAGSRLELALGPGLRVLERVEAPVLDLGPDWEAVYREKASRKTRQTHGRKRRRLAELGRLELEEATTWEELEPALEESFRVHALRWHGRPDRSGLGSSEVRAFQREGYRALADLGVARILTLRLDGKVVAYNCYLVFRNRLYSHRLGFDPDYGRWSPGLLCTLAMCERACVEGLERIELLGGGEEYKLLLADRFEPLMEGVGLARTVRGRAAGAARLGAIRARRRLKRLRPLHRFYLEGLAPARRAVGRLRGRSATTAVSR